MRRKLLVKSAACVCAGVLAVSSVSFTNIQPVAAYENMAATDKEATNLIGTFDSGDVADYKYMGYIGCDIDSSYKYLKMTYSGDADILGGMRWEMRNSHDETIGFFWFSENAQGTFKTVEGGLVPMATAEEQTVIIDLEASGIDLSDGISAFHMHANGATGTLTISDAAFMKTLESEEPAEATNFVLDGDEKGESSLVGAYKGPTIKGEPVDDYKYLGFATLKDATPDCKYLIMTFDGNITQLRFQFAQVVDGNQTAISEPYWFNAEGQTYHFETADGSDIPLSGEKQTIVIDLEKTGISLADYNSIHMHCDLMATYGNFEIINARLSNQSVVTEADKEAPVKPEVETPTEQTTGEVITTTTTTTKTEVKAPGKTKITNATRKKGEKRVKITLKSVKGATGYQVKVSTKKSFSKKATKTVETKKLKLTVKKLKKAKKYYVKARAYVKVKSVKKYGKWTKVKTVK